MSLRLGLLVLLLSPASDASALDSGNHTSPNDFGKAEVQKPESVLVRLQRIVEQLRTRQIKLRDETTTLKKIVDNNNGKATAAEEKMALALADKQQELVRLSEKAIAIIEKETSAVAVAEVFQQLRSDMQTVERRLRKTDVGLATLSIEDDLVATLEDLLDALNSRCKIA